MYVCMQHDINLRLFLVQITISVFPRSNLNHFFVDDSHLPGLVYAVRNVYQWDILGELLGISYATVRTIEQDNHFQTKPARRDMLIHWISSGKANKATLIEALKSMNENSIALEIQSQTL